MIPDGIAGSVSMPGRYARRLPQHAVATLCAVVAGLKLPDVERRVVRLATAAEATT
jgi:hypothetical protein